LVDDFWRVETSFFDASVSFLVVSVDDFFIDDFLVVDVLAGDFSGIVVVVLVSLLLVQAPMRPAANRTVNE
jgi:predicted HAD superfamily phosphohydrolase YqeG